MHKLLLLSAVSLSTVILSGAASDPPSLVQNEYAFAKAVADHGVRDGFLKYLDKQAITLAPQPANAFDLYTNRKPSGSKLSWYPTFALLSASGDFGVDTGPWRADWTKDGKSQVAHGDWVTVWHFSKDGHWRALFDGGIDHEAPEKAPKALAKKAKVARLPESKATTEDEVHGSLQVAEAMFSNTAMRSGPKAAYESEGTDDLRLLEEGSQPQVGKAAVLAFMSLEPAAVQWEPAGGSAAVSGDLGYLYGLTYKVEDKEHKSPQGSYMHVWRRDQGEWKLLIDLELPVPPQP